MWEGVILILPHDKIKGLSEDHINVNVQHHSRNSGGRKQKDAGKREGVEEEPVGGRKRTEPSF